MSSALQKLHVARETLGPILGRRRQTTEAELDECAETLEEIKRAIPRIRDEEATLIILASLDEIAARIKNRPNGT